MDRPVLAIIGLGYVGLPLALEFALNDHEVIGYDRKESRIVELNEKRDRTREVSHRQWNLLKNKKVSFTHCESDLQGIKIFVITVPTPIDEYRKPDLSALIDATRIVAKVLLKDSYVIYESTVFPGCTEEVCVPILEEESGLKYNRDFFCGYSPERINPGERTRPIADIVKITSGSTPEASNFVDDLYSTIIKAGTHKVSSIKVAEAAKVIENTQRDLNIAFVNELALIFEKLNIDTKEVLSAAGTKWNFIPFHPGLVGGHCIGVDPYYLTYKAESAGYSPEIILAGRRINDGMGTYVAHRAMKLMTRNDIPIKNTSVTVLGITFKENFGDIRNSKVIDIVRELEAFGVEVSIYDPIADAGEVKKEYDLATTPEIPENSEVLILAVAHREFQDLPWKQYKEKGTLVFDVKSVLDPSVISERL